LHSEIAYIYERIYSQPASISSEVWLGYRLG
jgi:hypothetical protein